MRILLRILEKMTRPRMDEYLFLKPVSDLTDDDLLTLISNQLDWSIDQVIEEAAREINSSFTPEQFWKTALVSSDIRHELRRAYAILNAL